MRTYKKELFSLSGLPLWTKPKARLEEQQNHEQTCRAWHPRAQLPIFWFSPSQSIWWIDNSRAYRISHLNNESVAIWKSRKKSGRKFQIWWIVKYRIVWKNTTPLGVQETSETSKELSLCLEPVNTYKFFFPTGGRLYNDRFKSGLMICSVPLLPFNRAWHDIQFISRKNVTTVAFQVRLIHFYLMAVFRLEYFDFG